MLCIATRSAKNPTREREEGIGVPMKGCFRYNPQSSCRTSGIAYRAFVLVVLVLIITAACGREPPAVDVSPVPPVSRPTDTPEAATATIELPPSTQATNTAEADRTEDDAADDAPTDEVLIVEGSGHPRLFFDADDVAGLREQAQTTHRAIWEPIEAFATDGDILEGPPPANADFEFFRAYGDQLIALAFGCLVSEQGDVCARARDTLVAAAAWEHWDAGEMRDLGLAHMLSGNAIAYDWLYGVLTDDERELVRRSLAMQGGRMFEASIAEEYDEGWSNWWTSAFMQNHNWVNHSGLGMAGLALLEEEEAALDWVAHAQERAERIRYILNGIGDGTWHEGHAYQQYGLNNLLAFLTNLRKIQGVDMFPHDYLQAYSRWMIYNYIPGSLTFIMAYGDFEWEWFNAALPVRVLRFVAAEYSDGYAEWTAQQLLKARGSQRDASLWQAPWFVYEFLSYDPTLDPMPPDDLARAAVFDDLSAVIWRTGWGTDDVVFGFKAGVYAGRFGFGSFTDETYPWDEPCAGIGCVFNIGHDHLDTNTFYIYGHGSWLAPEDVGVDQSATAYHNTLLIDREGQYKPPENDDGWGANDFIDTDGYIEMTASTRGVDYVAADATNRYRNTKDIIDVTRHVLFVRPDYFLMLDSIVAEETHRYEWVMHADNDMTRFEDTLLGETWIRAEGDRDAVLGIFVLAPELYDTTIGENDLPYVRIRPTRHVADVRLAHLLFPTTEDDWVGRPQGEIVEDSGTAVLANVALPFADGVRDEIIIVYWRSGGTQTGTIGTYAFDGAAAIVSRHEDGSLARLFTADATRLSDTGLGIDLLRLSNAVPCEAVYDGETLHVSGDVSGGVRLYAPAVEMVEVNGEEVRFTRDGEYIEF